MTRLDITLRPMLLTDLSRVIEFWKSMDGLLLLPGEGERSTKEMLQKFPGISKVAVDREGEIVGTICAGYVGVIGRIEHLAVHPDYRQNGIARELHRQCCESLRESGVFAVTAAVLTSNTDGMKMWTKWGYKDETNHHINLDLVISSAAK